MNGRIIAFACTEEDMEQPWPVPPACARDGSCAHAQVDPLDRCRFCGVMMDEAAIKHRLIAEYEDL